MANDAIIIWGSLLIAVASVGVILSVVTWGIISHMRDREALPGFEDRLENRPDKLTAITYGKRGQSEVRYVPPTEVIEVIKDNDRSNS